MKNNTKLIWGVCLVASALGLFYLLYKNIYTYAFILFALVLVFLVLFMKELTGAKSSEMIYDGILRSILKTYDAVLIDIEKVPDIDVRNIIKVSSFEKLIDAQIELRKPIFYKMSMNSCSFILLDEEEVYIFVLRMNEDSFSPLDDIILEIEQNSDKKKKNQHILDGIERTTIIKLDNMKSYKVSPIREKDVNEAKEKSFLEKLKREYLPKK